jgi:hypothetical protein
LAIAQFGGRERSEVLVNMLPCFYTKVFQCRNT